MGFNQAIDIARPILAKAKLRVEELEKEVEDTGGELSRAICKSAIAETELQSLKERELSKGELIKILRDNIDCEYHHRTQIKDTAQAIIDAREKKK